MSVLSKLKLVYSKAPAELKPRIAKLIRAVALSEPQGVGAPVLQQTKPKMTPLLVLQENADSFLSLMRTLPKDSPFKKVVSEMEQLAKKLGEKLEESGQELSKILQTDEEDLPGIKASALGNLADLLQAEKIKLADLEELSKTLNTLAGKVNKEEKNSPVKHELGSKEVGKKKKKPPSEIGKEEKKVEIPSSPVPTPKNPSSSSDLPSF